MKQQLDAFIEKHSKARAIQIDKKYDKNQISVFENANRSYVKGAELLKPMLIEALEALEFYKNQFHFTEHGGANYTTDGSCCPNYAEPESPSGEPLSYLEGHGDYSCENGTLAKQTLEKIKTQIGASDGK